MNNSSPAHFPRAILWTLVITGSGIALLVILNILASLALHSPYLRNDDWNFYSDYLELGSASFIIHKYFGHSWIIPKLLFIADLELFRGTRLPVMLLGASLHAIAAGILATLLWQKRPATTPEPLVLAACALIVGAIVWMSRHLELTWPFMTANTLVVACATIGAWALYRYLEQSQSGINPVFNRWLWIMVTMGIMATMTFGAGVALLPAIIMIMMIYRIAWTRIAIFAGFAALITTAYMALPSETQLPPITLALLVEVLPSAKQLTGFFLVFLGTAINFSLFPFEGARTGLPWLAATLATIGLSVLLWYSWRHYRRDHAQRDPVVAVPLMLAWFAVIAGLMAALGRANFAGFDIPNDYRYTTWSALFWASLLWLGLYHYMQLPPRPRYSYIFGISAIVACAVFATASFHGIHHMLGYHYQHRLAGLSLVIAPAIRISDARILSPAQIEQRLEMLPEMRRRAHNPFDQQWTHHIGRSLNAHYQLDNQAECLGIWRRDEDKSAVTSHFYTGWAAGPAGGFRTLLLVTGDTIIGAAKPTWIGTPAQQFPDTPELPGATGHFMTTLLGNNRAWIGITNQRFATEQTISVYGLLDETTVCPVEPYAQG